MPERMDFELGFGRSEGRRKEDVPMRLLVMGDFSHRPASQRRPLAERPTLQVDVDELDASIRRLSPRVRLESGEIAVEEMEDLHPDRLFAKLPLFQALRDARSGPVTKGSDLLGSLLGASETASPRPSAPAGKSTIDDLIGRIVQPHVSPDTRAEERAHAGAVDAAVSDQMRKLLHDPGFRSLESAWRGIERLVSGIELDENLQLHLFDVGRDELLADIGACGGRMAESGLYRALVDRWRNQPGAEGWSVIFSLESFGPSDADIGLLAALGIVASQAGGPLIAGGDAGLAGGTDADLDGWVKLRASEVAPWIGLVAGRLLMRQPYGAKSDRTESFAFEEVGNSPENAEFLWGSGALACAELLGRGFSAHGWAFSPDAERDVADLPSVTRRDRDGESELVPSAETFLSDSQAEALLRAGLMPLVSHRNRNAARLVRFQSIADPPARLRGLPG